MRPPSTFPDQAQVSEAFEAVRAGKLRQLQTLLYISPKAFHGAIDPCGSGDTLLHAAIKARQHETIEYLLGKNFPVTESDGAGQNLLHLATTQTFAASILQRAGELAGAMMVEQDFKGNLPFHALAKAGNVNALRYLLSVTPNLDKALSRPNQAGDTALHEIAKNTPELVALALRSGVDPRIENATGKRPADLCTDEKMRTLIRAHVLARDKSEEASRAELTEAAKAAEALKAAERARAFAQSPPLPPATSQFKAGM